MNDYSKKIAEAIGIDDANIEKQVTYAIINSVEEDGYLRQLIEYDSFGDKVRAYLLIPEVKNNNPAIIIHHQHNGERHLGKSEVIGLEGNPLQSFGPILAKEGFVVLAPDSICFEERRKNGSGTKPLPNDGDFLQHYNEMCYRIISGDNLMNKVLTDAINGVTLLCELGFVDHNRIGSLGHSYGGSTTLFLTALDKRITFGCASGSACTYKNRIKNDVGIEMSSVIPNFYNNYDIEDLVKCIAPRDFLIVSANDDKYSRDAGYIFEQSLAAYANYNAIDKLHHKQYQGEHALTRERFDYIIDWISKR